MISVFSHQVGRRRVHFSRHAVTRYHTRCHPELTRKQARDQLKLALVTGNYLVVGHNPPWIKPSLWSQGLAKDWLVIDDTVAIPLNQDLDGRWVAPTCMIKETEKLA